MPLTQSRMIAIIEVALEYSAMLDEMHDHIDAALARKRADMNAGAEIELLHRVVADLRQSRKSITLLAVEETHFSTMRLHNDRARQYMENKRRNQGVARRWPSEEQTRHRVGEREAELSVGQPIRETTTEKIERIVKEVERREAQAEIDKAQAEVDTKAQAPEAPREAFADWDQEALDVEETWKNDPDSIVGS